MPGDLMVAPKNGRPETVAPKEHSEAAEPDEFRLASATGPIRRIPPDSQPGGDHTNGCRLFIHNELTNRLWNCTDLFWGSIAGTTPTGKSMKAAKYRALRLVANRRGRRGMTLIELMAVVTIMGILAGIVGVRAREMRYRAEIVKAMGDINAMQLEIDAYEVSDLPLPVSLDAIGRGWMLDPWGNPYVYAPFPPSKGNAPPKGARKDRFLVPINSTYDLYSVGRDGASVAPLTAKASRDDIIRGNDGGFIGLGSNF